MFSEDHYSPSNQPSIHRHTHTCKINTVRNWDRLSPRQHQIFSKNTVFPHNIYNSAPGEGVRALRGVLLSGVSSSQGRRRDVTLSSASDKIVHRYKKNVFVEIYKLFAVCGKGIYACGCNYKYEECFSTFLWIGKSECV